MNPRALSTLDAFFLAYQRRAQIAMHMGVTLTLDGELSRDVLENALAQLITRWPALGAPVTRRGFGLAQGHATPAHASALLVPLRSHEDLSRARNTLLDPLSQAPLRLYWHEAPGEHTLVLCVHHALMDGEGVMAVILALLRALTGEPLAERAAETPANSLANHPAWSTMLRAQAQRNRRDRARTPSRLALGLIAPGPLEVHSEHLTGSSLTALRARADRAGVSLSAWIIAAWIHALHAHVVPSGPVSVEVPVSLRARNRTPDALGNHVAPITFWSETQRDTEAIAKQIRSDFRHAIQSGMHLVDALTTAPIAKLPWALFERVVVNADTTGNATSHVAALRLPRPLTAHKASPLRLRAWQPFSPVCLRMGVALTAIDAHDELMLSLTYRTHSISQNAAQDLTASLMTELLAPHTAQS
ncbi:MAG: hypothetical protein Q8Q09_04520 [Deltaproteobacteria bacterium]|nr:hypothetical protein [Deltaproteobacteria bacterium]